MFYENTDMQCLTVYRLPKRNTQHHIRLTLSQGIGEKTSGLLHTLVEIQKNPPTPASGAPLNISHNPETPANAAYSDPESGRYPDLIHLKVLRDADIHTSLLADSRGQAHDTQYIRYHFPDTYPIGLESNTPKPPCQRKISPRQRWITPKKGRVLGVPPFFSCRFKAERIE